MRDDLVGVEKGGLTLNAGCGCDEWGDVRVDVQRFGMESLVLLRPASANLLASVEHLPFRDGVFGEARCFHVLEHLDRPRQALGELMRVSGKVVVRVPIWHLYSLIIEALALPYFFIRAPRKLGLQFRRIQLWKRRYGEHKWYIRFDDPRVRRVTLIPNEYEKVFHSEREQKVIKTGVEV